MIYSFLNDYSEGCHPSILESLQTHNTIQEIGYAGDSICAQASDLFKQKINNPTADIHFVTGGTQANLICLASMLKPFEAIIAAESAHIAANEAGAIEATGHKIITKPSLDGKLTVTDIEQSLQQFSLHPHMVRPKVVYITNATEKGTVYTKQELTNISQYCKQHGLYLFMDGARLAMALASPCVTDVSLADIAELTDMFWFGGTKNGALLGEAIIITHDDLKIDFKFHLKQRGAMLAKARVIGTQFVALLTDDLYLNLASHANLMAKKIADAIIQAGFELTSKTESNQIFAMLPCQTLEKLKSDFLFYEWEKRETNSLVRLVTSWATDEKQVDKFITRLKHIK